MCVSFVDIQAEVGAFISPHQGKRGTGKKFLAVLYLRLRKPLCWVSKARGIGPSSQPMSSGLHH